MRPTGGNAAGTAQPNVARFRGGDVRSPRSREDRAWKCIEKIPIDESAFPAHVKPAAIIIGVKGSNHARMQDEAGCCVQLRGRGISSPGTPGADEPIHLWVKYDSPDQLQRVRDVLQEIIRSCEKGPPPELRKKPPPVQARGGRPPQFAAPVRAGMPLLSDLPDVLPPLPTRPPTSPLECFFTLHYLAHARSDVTTDNLESVYESVFGYPLEERLRSLGGSLVASLMMLPQIIKLEEVHTGAPPTQPPDPAAVFYIRPVLPIGFSWQLFSHHVNSMHSAAQPPPPPPPAPARLSPPAARPYEQPTPQIAPVRTAPDFDSNVPLPTPSNLAVQALHAILTERALKQGRPDENRTSPTAPETVRQWPGVPLSEIDELFAQEVGFKLDTPALGYADLATFLLQVASPDVLEVYWNPQFPPHGCHFVRIGSAGLRPDFRLLNAK